MDFAAAAVADVVAPPPRAGGGRSPTPDAADSASFDEHLQTAQETHTDPVAAPAPADSESSAADGATASGAGDSAAQVADGAQQQIPLPHTSTLAVHFMANAAPHASIDGAVNTALQTPADAAPITPAPPPAQGAAAATTPAAAQRSDPAVAAPQNIDRNSAPAAPATTAGKGSGDAAPTTPSVQASSATSGTAPSQPLPSGSAPSAAPVIANAEATTQRIAPVAPPPESVRELGPRAAKHNLRATAEPEATPRHGPPPQAHAAAIKNAAKVAPAPVNVKDAVAIAPLDAPDAALPQTTSTAAAPQTASQTQHAALDQAAVRTAPAAHQVAREIVRRFDGDGARFELRLDPPELGRIEVRLDVSRDHRVSAMIMADSPQALTELARNARELEQMLQSAGLELSDSGLSFDLRQGSEGGDAGDGAAAPGESDGEQSTGQVAPQARPLGFERWRGVRVDMMV